MQLTNEAKGMQFSYRTLNKVITEVITWGNPFDSKGKDVIVCVTGNPGVPDFYIEFGEQLHKSTGFPVCHAGHVHVLDVESNILNPARERLYNLEGQIAHKLDLITNHIDKKCKLHLIGHSIGAWMILEILGKHESIIQRVSSINLLFPTIQKMAESRNGKYLNGFLRKIHPLLILLFILVNLLPEFIREFLISLYLKVSLLPPHYCERIMKYTVPSVGEKVLFLAYDEMDRVRDLNTDALNKVKHLTNVIYGSKDGWAPVSYMEDLKQFEPLLQMKQVDISHAFVLKSSEEVAEMVSDNIKTRC
ncbi:lipid-droplet associated hydrolase domain-containing protein [Phthorimaea operculella]|nr:lipid-droplet associated hydrolase domain-containing protein [Phthorimaea operculella]